jgi:hypothetical protein
MEAVTVLISIVSLCFSLFTWYRALIHDRKKDTLDAFNVLQQQALDPLQSYTRARIREIAEDSRSEEYRIVSTYLARIEHFCVGVEQKIYDQRTVWELSEGFLNRGVYEKLKPIIEHKNQQNNYYRNFLTVVQKMNREEA